MKKTKKLLMGLKMSVQALTKMVSDKYLLSLHTIKPFAQTIQKRKCEKKFKKYDFFAFNHTGAA